MGDQFNLSGDFRGSIVNIKSQLRDVQQSVGEIPGGEPADRQQLQKLIQDLSTALEQTPLARQEQAEAVASTAKALVEQAATPKPNHTMLQITGEGLKAAAKNLADITPTVLAIATQVVMTVGRLTGGLG